MMVSEHLHPILLTAAPGSTVPLAFCEIGNPTVDLGIVLSDGVTNVIPTTIDGQIQIDGSCPVGPPVDVFCMYDGVDVTLTWENGNHVYTGIEVERNGSLVGTVAGGVESFTDVGVPMGLYRYIVRGVDSGAGCSAASEPCVERVNCPTGGPAAVTCIAVGQDVILTWDEGSNTYTGGVVIERDGMVVGSVTAGVGAFTDFSVPPGDHDYLVRGLYDGGCFADAPFPCLVTLPDPNYTLSLSSATGSMGGSVDIRVSLDFPDGEPVTQIVFGVCASPDDGSIVDNPCDGSTIPNDCIDNEVIVPRRRLGRGE